MNSRRQLWTKKILNPSQLSPVSINPNVTTSGLILGIDPSLRGSGFAVLKFDKDISLLESVTLKLPAKYTFVECLGEIFTQTKNLLDKYEVNSVSIEQTVYVQNKKTVHILGASRGATLSAVALKNLTVSEYSPLRIKKSVVGIGNASKLQVSKMVKQLLNLSDCLPYDESDAAAVALCHIFSLKSLIKY